VTTCHVGWFHRSSSVVLPLTIHVASNPASRKELPHLYDLLLRQIRFTKCDADEISVRQFIQYCELLQLVIRKIPAAKRYVVFATERPKRQRTDATAKVAHNRERPPNGKFIANLPDAEPSESHCDSEPEAELLRSIVYRRHNFVGGKPSARLSSTYTTTRHLKGGKRAFLSRRNLDRGRVRLVDLISNRARPPPHLSTCAPRAPAFPLSSSASRNGSVHGLQAEAEDRSPRRRKTRRSRRRRMRPSR
jgi:hypothetical protein